jgi:acetyl esterase
LIVVLVDAQIMNKESRVKKMTYPIQPTFSNVAYGSHKRNVFDIWLTDSKKRTPLALFIHGGGYRSGDKKHISLTFL